MSSTAIALPRLRIKRWRPRRDKAYVVACVVVCLLYMLTCVVRVATGHFEIVNGLSLAVWTFIYSREHKRARQVFRSQEEVPIPRRDWYWLVFAWSWLAVVVASFAIA